MPNATLFMPSDEASRILIDIRHSIALATSWVAPLSVSEFEADLKTFYADDTRFGDHLGSELPPTGRACRETSRRSMRDAGNFYRHNYDRVLEEFVWSAITKSLPALLAVVDTELARIDRYPEGRDMTIHTKPQNLVAWRHWRLGDHRGHGDPCPGDVALEAVLRRLHRVRRRAQLARLAGRRGDAGHAAGDQRGMRGAGGAHRARPQGQDQQPLGVRPQELLLSRPAAGLSDLAVQGSDRRRGHGHRST